jgi:heme-degrading monooxygenase HmoA
MTKHNKKAPYYAVIFSAKFAKDLTGYDKIAKEMLELAKKQKGFIGIESIKDGNKEITVSYWETLEDIRNWNINEQHSEAKEGGKTKWYENFSVKICKVEREYSFGN